VDFLAGPCSVEGGGGRERGPRAKNRDAFLPRVGFPVQVRAGKWWPAPPPGTRWPKGRVCIPTAFCGKGGGQESLDEGEEGSSRPPAVCSQGRGPEGLLRIPCPPGPRSLLPTGLGLHPWVRDEGGHKILLRATTSKGPPPRATKAGGWGGTRRPSSGHLEGQGSALFGVELRGGGERRGGLGCFWTPRKHLGDGFSRATGARSSVGVKYRAVTTTFLALGEGGRGGPIAGSANRESYRVRFFPREEPKSDSLGGCQGGDRTPRPRPTHTPQSGNVLVLSRVHRFLPAGLPPAVRRPLNPRARSRGRAGSEETPMWSRVTPASSPSDTGPFFENFPSLPVSVGGGRRPRSSA